jgi:hypothetical protein
VRLHPRFSVPFSWWDARHPAAAFDGATCEGCGLQRPTRLRPGTPVDRYYIERFQSEHAERIRGNVLEVKDASYTRRFGAEVYPFVVDIDSE